MVSSSEGGKWTGQALLKAPMGSESVVRADVAGTAQASTECKGLHSILIQP